MSFSSELKKELCRIDNAPCCMLAEAYGLLLFGRSFGTRGISLMTESADVAKRYRDNVRTLFGIAPEITRSDAGNYTVSISGASARTVIEKLGYTGKEVTARLNMANIENPCCTGAFLRGVFLAVGSVTNPEREYHFELLISRAKLTDDLIRFMSDIDDLEISPKRIRRSSGYAIYFKNADSIEDLIGLIGGNASYFKVMNVRATKAVVNKINRRMNFENANLDRTINASVAQRKWIASIERYSSLGGLTDDLRTLALLRKANPEMSLDELGGHFDPPLSRSAVNRRFKKLELIARELEEKG